MTQLLFRNRWLAAMWVVVSLITVASYVGEGGGHEQVDAASAQLKAQQAAMDQGAAVMVEGQDDGFSAEKDLIDTTGDDEEEAAKRAAAAVPAPAATYVVVHDPAAAEAPAVQP